MGETASYFRQVELAEIKLDELKEAADGTYAAMWLDKDSTRKLFEYYKLYIPNIEIDFHVTTTHSKVPVPQLRNKDIPMTLDSGSFFYEEFGDTLVLRVKNPILTKLWETAKNMGAQWDFPEYKPRITLSKDKGAIIKQLPPPPSFNLYAHEFKVEPLQE